MKCNKCKNKVNIYNGETYKKGWKVLMHYKCDCGETKLIKTYLRTVDDVGMLFGD